jgi:hypothetical protein
MSAATSDGDLGFVYRARKTGEVQVLHHGRLAATLRGSSAREFLAELEGCGPVEEQQLMARVTGNYKHGNERLASSHHRNRK